MKIPAEIQALCFDAVGTLLVANPEAALVYAEVGTRYGSEQVPETIRSRFTKVFAEEEALDLAANWRTGEDREYRRWQSIVAKVLDDVTDPEACFRELYTHFSRPDAWRCVEGTAEALEKLAERGYRLALASNFDQRLRSVVAGKPELKKIHYFIISSEVGWRKPALSFFQAVCRILQLPAHQIFFIGDDPANDYQGAVQAGLPAALVHGEAQTAGEPDTLFRHLLEVAPG